MNYFDNFIYFMTHCSQFVCKHCQTFVFNFPNPSLFVYFRSFLFNNNFVDFSRIRTRIVGVPDEHAEHLTTTTTAQAVGFELGSLEYKVRTLIT